MHYEGRVVGGYGGWDIWEAMWSSGVVERVMSARVYKPPRYDSVTTALFLSFHHHHPPARAQGVCTDHKCSRALLTCTSEAGPSFSCTSCAPWSTSRSEVLPEPTGDGDRRYVSPLLMFLHSYLLSRLLDMSGPYTICESLITPSRTYFYCS